MAQYIDKENSMTQEELINVFKYIVKKCDMLINNGNYEADSYTQDNVEDIAELCNHILDGDYGKLVESKEVDLEKEIDNIWKPRFSLGWDEKSLLSMNHEGFTTIVKYFFELGLKVAQKGE